MRAGSCDGSAKDRELVLAAEIRGRDDIADVRPSSDEQRAFVDHGLVEVSGLSVFRMVAPNNRAAKILSESSNDFFAHNVPPEYS
jgi:hypothetical protein